ncbi:MAG: HAD-IB family hydrolase, partial [Actinomycetota bacterium]|nr:HAD-IB family hydrolase [Actinomycetota bacterium]
VGGTSPSSQAGVAAFDFDGTLVPGDSLRPYLMAVLGRVGMATALARAASPMLRGYATDGRDGAKAALLVRALAGVPVAHAADIGVRFGAALASRVKPDLAARLRWHRDRGHRLILVSASLTLYLDEFGHRAGFDQVIATKLAVSGLGPDAVLTGVMEGTNVRAQEKERRLRAAIGEDPVELWAYGDSAGDREMLAMADHPYRVDGRRLTLSLPAATR